MSDLMQHIVDSGHSMRSLMALHNSLAAANNNTPVIWILYKIDALNQLQVAVKSAGMAKTGPDSILNLVHMWLFVLKEDNNKVPLYGLITGYHNDYYEICYSSGVYQLVKLDMIVMWMLSPGEHVQATIRQDCLSHVFRRRTKTRYFTEPVKNVDFDKPVVNMTLFEYQKRGSLHAHQIVMRRKVASSSLRVKERHGDRTGTVKGSYLKNNIKFVSVLWDGDVDVCDEKHHTSESVMKICVKKNNQKSAVSLKQSDKDHVDKKRTFDLSDVSELAAQYYLKPQTFV